MVDGGKSVYPIRVVAENTCNGSRRTFKLWNSQVVGKPRPWQKGDAGCSILLKTTKLGKGRSDVAWNWFFKSC